MAKNKGRAFLLKIEDPGSPGTYITVGGMIANTITGTQEAVDTTTKDDAGVRKLGENFGVKSYAISGNGLFDDDTGFDAAHDHWVAGTHANFKIINEDNDSYTGLFQITQIERSGENNGAEAFSISLESAAAVTFA